MESDPGAGEKEMGRWGLAGLWWRQSEATVKCLIASHCQTVVPQGAEPKPQPASSPGLPMVGMNLQQTGTRSLPPGMSI